MENLNLDLNEKFDFFNDFLRALEKCPHVIKSDIGGQEFARELIRGTMDLARFFKDYSE